MDFGSVLGQDMACLLLCSGRCGGAGLEAEAVVSGLQDVAAVGEAIEQGCGHLCVAKDRGPFAEAQVCGASTYACAGLYGYSGDIDAITIKDKSGTLCSFSGKKCSSSTSHLGVVNAGSPIDLTAGQTITVDITGTSWSGYTTSPGVWIDANIDNSFAAGKRLRFPLSLSDHLNQK